MLKLPMKEVPVFVTVKVSEVVDATPVDLGIMVAVQLRVLAADTDLVSKLTAERTTSARTKIINIFFVCFMRPSPFWWSTAVSSLGNA